MQKCWKSIVGFFEKYKTLVLITLLFVVMLAINIGIAYSAVQEDLSEYKLRIELNNISISNLENDLPVLDEEIAELEAEISGLENKISELEAEISELYESLQ